MNWDFINSERKRLGIRLNWKSVSAGEVCQRLTALNAGRGKEWVEARCECGNVSKYTAASLKGGGRNGGVRQCSGCDSRSDAALAWKSPKKWVNPKPIPTEQRSRAVVKPG